MNRELSAPGRRLRVLAPGLLLFTLTSTAAGQGRSVLELLDAGTRTIAVGETRVGQLSGSDWRSVNDSYLQAWSVTLTAGQQVYLELVSDAFDAYLYLIGPGLDDTMADDDGAGACHSRIGFVPRVGGRFQVVVSSLGSRSEGEFSLRVDRSPSPDAEGSCGGGDAAGDHGPDPQTLAALDPQGRRLALGEPVAGALGDADQQPDGEMLQSWAFMGEAGSSVTFDLVSREFDTYLYFVGPTLEVQSNDDDGGACNARITVVLPETGEYRVIASAFGSGSGAFTIMASREAPPQAEGPCPGSSTGFDPDSLFAMAVMGPPLAAGDTVAAALSTGDRQLNDAYVQVWEHVATEGRPFTVDLRSDAFDALLYVAGPDLADYTRDDDGGGGCQSRATVRPSRSGTYRIVATSIGGGVGDYALSVSDLPGPAADGGCGGDDMVTPAALPLTELDAEGRTLQFGATATGEMTASDQVEASMFQAWEFQGTAGESVTIDLMSDQFDAYLYLVGPGLTQPLTDDDGGEGLNSRIATTIPATGTYRVIVSMLGQDTGFFTLRVSRNP